MTKLEAFNHLLNVLDELYSQLSEHLAWAITQNRPEFPGERAPRVQSPNLDEDQAPYLYDYHDEAALNLAGFIQEARLKVNQALVGSGETPQMSRYLAESQVQFEKTLAEFFDYNHPGSFERLQELAEIERQSGHPWSDWAYNVRVELGRTQQALLSANLAYLYAWQALAQEAGRGPVIVQNTSIGKQISLPAEQASVAQEAT
jgi:hypothetical protein